VTTPFAFNPLDPATRRDPYALYARGRDEAPAYLHAGLPLRVVSLFRYEDVQATLRDDARFSNAPGGGMRGQAAEQLAVIPPSMLVTDGAEHARLRGLVNKAFTPRIVSRLEGRMHALAEELVTAAARQGEADLVQALTYPLPVTVIAEIIGIPAEHRAQFKAWSDRAVASLGLAFFGGLDAERVRAQIALREEMKAYLIPLAEERRRAPREDLMTGLVQAEHEGSRLSHDEMLQMLILLLVAGNETTTTLIQNTVLELLAHPEWMARARADRALAPALIEETLRHSSPVQFAPRRARTELALHGVEIRPDDFVFCWIGSANRDPKVFDDPERFDPLREANPHIAFGFGPHYCLGANLARLEARVALEALLEKTSRIEAAWSGDLSIHPSPVFRGVTELPVRLTPA
jgi:cytochrome P450